MKESPIIFSTPMVQVILEGRKTQTRRILSFHINNGLSFKQMENNHAVFSDNFFESFPGYDSGEYDKKIKCQFGKPGDLMWVREAFAKVCIENYPHPEFIYRASEGEVIDVDGNILKWKPSIFMPKEASRIWLQIENIRAEQVQHITEEDAKAEGIRYNDGTLDNTLSGYVGFNNLKNIDMLFDTAKESFQSLWYKIHSQKAWDHNPWVWVISFKVLSTTGKPQNLSA